MLAGYHFCQEHAEITLRCYRNFQDYTQSFDKLVHHRRFLGNNSVQHGCLSISRYTLFLAQGPVISGGNITYFATLMLFTGCSSTIWRRSWSFFGHFCAWEPLVHSLFIARKCQRHNAFRTTALNSFTTGGLLHPESSVSILVLTACVRDWILNKLRIVFWEFTSKSNGSHKKLSAPATNFSASLVSLLWSVYSRGWNRCAPHHTGSVLVLAGRVGLGSRTSKWYSFDSTLLMTSSFIEESIIVYY